MRKSMIVKAVLILASTVVSIQAIARPYKIDYHPAICQKINGASISYHVDNITVSGVSIIVCPMEQVTLPDDSVAMNHVTFKVWLSAGTSTSPSSCELDSGSSTFASLSTFPSTLTLYSLGGGLFPLPTAVGSDPAEMHVTCDFEAAGKLGAMQVMMVP